MQVADISKIISRPKKYGLDITQTKLDSIRQLISSHPALLLYPLLTPPQAQKHRRRKDILAAAYAVQGAQPDGKNSTLKLHQSDSISARCNKVFPTVGEETLKNKWHGVPVGTGKRDTGLCGIAYIRAETKPSAELPAIGLLYPRKRNKTSVSF